MNTGKIALVSIGSIDQEVITSLKDGLYDLYKWQVFAHFSATAPDHAYDAKRKQYLATVILNDLTMNFGDKGSGGLLGITGHDLYVPGLNFVFGLSGKTGALVSIFRLKPEFYALPPNRALFMRRVLTEAVHELGHTYGLGHCSDPACVMFFSNSIADTDVKGPGYCFRCLGRLKRFEFGS